MNFPRYKLWLLVAALLGGLSVGLGAFGAHGLENGLKARRSAGQIDANELTRRLANWETAAHYQMVHALALLAVGLLAVRRCGLAINLSGFAFTLGVLIFSGCLYALVLSGQCWLGAIVPLGGVLLILGWVCLAVAVWRDPVQ